MAWERRSVVELRFDFVSDYKTGIYSIAELCRSYKISRKTGYKWLKRYYEFGREGLEDISRAPHRHPHAVSVEIKSAVLEIKDRYPKCGARKIDWQLRKDYPAWRHYPALSTIGRMLKKEGLTSSRRSRRRTCPSEPSSLTNGLRPNDVWCADFKGHFKTGDGHKCYPLTITDHASRYLLCCRHIDGMNKDAVKRQFAWAFREYGVPLVIRTDNGTPFASNAIGGVSGLSAWWIRLGIRHERIQPGKPQQNGRHERMHRTLKQHTAMPPAMHIASQQKRFNEFMEYYNNSRPHEALGMRTPSQMYAPCFRDLSSKLPDIEYPEGYMVRKVIWNGFVFIGRRPLYISKCLAGAHIGFEAIGKYKSKLWYRDVKLGVFNRKKWKIESVRRNPQSAGVNPCPDDHKPAEVLPMSSVQSVTYV